MHVIADRVYPDEPVYGLKEGPESGRWIQKLWVIRGDRKARYTTDFGPVSDFPDATPIIYIGDGEDTVAEFQTAAQRDRSDDRWAKRRKEMQSESTLIADVLRTAEQNIAVRANRSVFAPGFSAQRIDYPRAAVEERKRENDRTNNR